MTLSEAIKHCEEVADYKDHDAELWDRSAEFWNNDVPYAIDKAKECRRCAEERRQLAEWMKELKAKRKQVEILARCLDGCPLTIPCDKMFVSGGWCERHCKERDLICPDSECWLRYAEVIANERLD